MDYIKELDIRLDKEYYYAGEIIAGKVYLDTSENFKLKSIRLVLRGKAHAEWKVFVSGDKRTVKDDQHFIDERSMIWGEKSTDGDHLSVPILTRGHHEFPFRFNLPETSLPCSFESRVCYIRYYIKVTLDIPYASSPQGVKYFTIIGPHLDCMDEQYLKPITGRDKKVKCCLCCAKGHITLSCTLDRTAYCCGEMLKLKASIDNQGEENVKLKVRLLQNCEFSVERGVMLTECKNKSKSNLVVEYIATEEICPNDDKSERIVSLRIPTLPTSLVGGVCRLVQVYYTLTTCLEFEKSGDDLHINFPVTIATVPFRIPNSNSQPILGYDVACEHVEGGNYICPEFLMGGEVYDGEENFRDYTTNSPLYRPVYITVLRTSQEVALKSVEDAARKRAT